MAVVSPEELAVYKADFAQFDTSCSGFLDKTELGGLVQHQLGRECTERELEEFLANNDTDHDFKLSLDEYIHSIIGPWHAAQMNFVVPAERKSSYDPAGEVSYSLINDTDGTVAMNWVDYEGNLVYYGDVATGGNYSGGTNTKHPWLIASGDQTELACICFTGGDVKLSQVLRQRVA